MNHIVGIVVGVVTLVNIAALLWLIWWTTRGSVPAQAQETTHVWDDDLTEYNNPLPRWWLTLFVGSIAFGLLYLLLFPGLGNFPGLIGWSSHAQYQAEEGTAARMLEKHLVGVDRKSVLELEKDPAAMATARNLFALNCSTCHGSDARGAKHFPNLTDGDWLWGGSPERVYETIAKGRDNMMPAWGPVIGPNGVEQVLAYVLTLSPAIGTRPAAAPEQVAAGKKIFQTTCFACHGMDGKGNPLIGAPNLTDNVWLHGGSIADIRETISQGRVNHMPAHLDRLGEIRVKLLAAYVLSLSSGQNPRAAPPAVAESLAPH